jgi:hypothetical protein
MKHYESRWETGAGAGNRRHQIVYNGRLMPNFYVPGILGSKMIRGDIERMMSAVLARLDRRDAPKVEAIPQKD